MDRLDKIQIGIALCGAFGGLIAIGMSVGNALEMTNFAAVGVRQLTFASCITTLIPSLHVLCRF